MSTMELKGLENRFPVKIVYIDTKEVVEFGSLNHASRITGIKVDTIKRSLNPIHKKRYIIDNREFVFRINNK